MTIHNKLEEVTVNTIDGDECLAEIKDIQESRIQEHTVKVTVRLPSGKLHTDKFDFPHVNSEQYELVRLLNDVGCGLIRSEDAVGSDVRVRITDDGPSIVVPSPSRKYQYTETIESILKITLRSVNLIVAIIAFPIWLAITLKETHQDIWGRPPSPEDWFVLYLLPVVFWASVVGFIIDMFIL